MADQKSDCSNCGQQTEEDTMHTCEGCDRLFCEKCDCRDCKKGAGIIQQISGARDFTKGGEGMPTLEDFKEMMEMISRNTDDKFLGEPIKYPETPDEGIRLKIKDGYLYQINGSWTIHTGSGGARRHVDICRAHGESDESIGARIMITETEGIITGQVWTPLNSITWNKKEDNANASK